MAGRRNLRYLNRNRIVEPEVRGKLTKVTLPRQARWGQDRAERWSGTVLVQDTVFLVTRVVYHRIDLWSHFDEDGRWRDYGEVRATGTLYMTKEGIHTLGIMCALGRDPSHLFEEAAEITWLEGIRFSDPRGDDVSMEIKVLGVEDFVRPSVGVTMWVPPFFLEMLGGLDRVCEAVATLDLLGPEERVIRDEVYRLVLDIGPFSEEELREVVHVLRAAVFEGPGIAEIGEGKFWEIVRREIGRGPSYIDDVHMLFKSAWEIHGTGWDVEG